MHGGENNVFESLMMKRSRSVLLIYQQAHERTGSLDLVAGTVEVSAGVLCGRRPKKRVIPKPYNQQVGSH